MVKIIYNKATGILDLIVETLLSGVEQLVSVVFIWSAVFRTNDIFRVSMHLFVPNN